MASIDNVIGVAQGLAMAAQSDAGNMYTTAMSATDAGLTMGTISDIDAIGDAVEPPTIDPFPELNPLLIGTVYDLVGASNYLVTDFTSAVPAQRTAMQAFVTGGLDAFIESFAPNYTALREDLEAKITAGMVGGTAISNAVETQIYDRATSRVEAENAAAQAELAATMAKRGFPLPAGALTAGLRAMQKDGYDRRARAAAETAIQRATLENEHARFCIQASQTLNSSVQQSLLAYAAVVASVNEAVLQYASALIHTTDLQFKNKVVEATTKFEAGKDAWEAEMASFGKGAEDLRRNFDQLLAKAAVILDGAKAATNSDLQVAQLLTQAHIAKIQAKVNVANAGASVQASIASAGISAGNTLVQQLEE